MQLCDVHTHTLFSRHAYSTLEEQVRAAHEAGLELIGISDHFSGMLFDMQTLRNFQYFINMHIWPRTWHDVFVLRACEVDIVDAYGHLFGWDNHLSCDIVGDYRAPYTLKDKVFGECDYVIASVHTKAWAHGRSPKELAAAYIEALQDPKVFILGHVGRSGLDFELKPVLEAARALGKCIELNESSFSGSAARQDAMYKKCRAIADAAAEAGVCLSFGSDAHISVDVSKQTKVTQIIEEVGIPEELLVCRSKDALLAQLKRAGVASIL